MRRFIGFFLALLAVAALPVAASAAPVSVAAAASLRTALDEAAKAFQAETGIAVQPIYGASGSLVQQIKAGAPFQLFLSADEEHVFRLADAGLTRDRGQVYGVGRLALVAAKGSSLAVDPELEGLRKALQEGRVKRFAIANPETAPYGKRAMEALTHAGLNKLAKPRLVYGENIGQALQFATTGGADGGLVSLSLVLNPASGVRYALVPDDWHQPLTQRIVLLKTAGADATRFHGWMLGPKGQALLARYGYTQAPTR